MNLYISPNTNVLILRNVPLDITYNHTIYFTSSGGQSSYFSGLAKYDLNNYSYQRQERNSIRVGIKSESLFDCNYLMFQNSSFGNKWFYAFIKSVEYINNVTSEITFEIDVMQTWFFNYEVNYCFVEREHSERDLMYDNFVPEPVNVGEYVYTSWNKLIDTTDYKVIVAIADTSQPANGNLYDGVFGGATLFAYNSGDAGGISAKLSEYVEKPEAVVAIYMCPSTFCPYTGQIPSNSYASDYSKTWSRPSGNETLDGYLPKNKKLYTYPYCFCNIVNANGQSLSLRYEFFESDSIGVKIEGNIAQPVELVCYPAGYKNVGSASGGLGGVAPYVGESISLGSFPICSWVNDTYQQWVAQNSVPLALNWGANVATGIAGGLALGNPIAGVALGAFSGAVNILSQGYQASIKADECKGSISSGSNKVSNGRMNFYFGRMTVTRQQAMILDDYFNRFGYATNRLKKPNRNSRPHWNYVKTQGCTLTGSIPSDDMGKICSIYDNGITFWKNGNEVGSYGLDNSPS